MLEGMNAKTWGRTYLYCTNLSIRNRSPCFRVLILYSAYEADKSKRIPIYVYAATKYFYYFLVDLALVKSQGRLLALLFYYFAYAADEYKHNAI